MAECSKCGSPYHGEDACPQALRRTKKSTFRTRKQMGIKAGEVPFKFRVDTDPEQDNETEISRKRSLLRLNSQRVYMQMGCAVKAYNSMKETAKWIANLFENMDEEDRATCAPVFMGMEGMLFGLESLSNQKIAQAIKMEEMVEEERKRVRAARMRLAKVSLDKSKKANEFGVFRLHGSSPNVSIFGDGGILDQIKFLLNEGKQSSGGKG